MKNLALNEAAGDVRTKILAALEIAKEAALEAFVSASDADFALSKPLLSALEALSEACSSASAAFTNIVTGLAIKVSLGSTVDVRYHQVQIQGQTNKPAGFNFRGISEQIIYPWLSQNGFEGAKSGWQTRVLERPKPYLLSYDENIQTVKIPFLTCYDQLETHNANALAALSFIIYKQIQLREQKHILLATPKTDNILSIVTFFEKHFFFQYRSKGASRLPVLAIYSIYKILISELGRFANMQLKPLELHSASDLRTGAVGDIEVLSDDGSVFEALEIKHDQVINVNTIRIVKEKIMDKTLDRFYILTTHHASAMTNEMQIEIDHIRELFNCQIIINGVIPSIKFYLRMLKHPSMIFPEYISLLASDKAIGHEHRSVWNDLVCAK